MRRRTQSEIKAYGDGYAEAYKQFCHLLEKNDKDKAIRKMELFAKAVEITVETATDEPQTERLCDKCKYYSGGEVCDHPSIGEVEMGGKGDTFPWIKETPKWCPLTDELQTESE